MTLAAGDKAPDFRLPATTGDFALDSALTRGALVVAFYPKDNTSG